MGIKSLFGFGQARDKPVDKAADAGYSFLFGRTTSGKPVNETTAMQTTAVYACKDKKHFWLYPLAIILHTGMDFIGGLYIFNVISLSPWMLEGIVSVFGLAVFFGSYLLFYKKDVGVLTKED